MRFRKISGILLLTSLLFLIPSCASKPVSQDVLTQKVTEPNRTPITVLVKYAFSINKFEKAVEEKFPEIDLIQVGNYTSNMGTAEYARRMEHDDLTDIVMTWPLEVGSEYWSDRLLDLSGMEFTSRYNVSMLNDIARDGKLYYLPGPSQVRGIVYNKTLFQEQGWQVPKDYEGFISLCQTIEKTGIRSIQLPFGNSEVLDTAFDGFGYASCFSTPQDSQWLADYNNGTGSFGDHFGPALDTFQEMIDAGVWKKEDLNITYAERETMLFTRQCAMVEDSVMMAKIGNSLTGTTDEFALMPFFNPGQDGDWARLYMVCYIGLNKHLAESANKEKYDLVMQLMDYISTPEGQENLAADTGAMFSSLMKVSPPDVPEIQELIPALEHGRSAIFPVLKNAQTALREGLAGMVSGEKTKDDVIRMVDGQNRNPPKAEQAKVLGQAAEDFTLTETANFMTDAMREQSGCELALFLDNGKDGKYNGKGVSARLYKGDQTEVDVGRIMPDLKHGETGTLCKVTMTGEDLVKTLEYSIPVDNQITGWFYYFSGLRMEYDPTAEPGSRLGKLTDAQGKAIDPQKEYSIAVMDHTVPEEFLKTSEDTGIKITEVITKAIQQQESISPSKDGRFTTIKK